MGAYREGHALCHARGWQDHRSGPHCRDDVSGSSPWLQHGLRILWHRISSFTLVDPLWKQVTVLAGGAQAHMLELKSARGAPALALAMSPRRLAAGMKRVAPAFGTA